MAGISQFRFPTDIRFGAGARSVLAEFARKYSVRRQLLVTDSGLPENSKNPYCSKKISLRHPCYNISASVCKLPD